MPISLKTIRPIILQNLNYALNLLSFYFVYFKACKTTVKHENEKTSPIRIRNSDLANSSRRI